MFGSGIFSFLKPNDISRLDVTLVGLEGVYIGAVSKTDDLAEVIFVGEIR